jgi:hypothetical protein
MIELWYSACLAWARALGTIPSSGKKKNDRKHSEIENALSSFEIINCIFRQVCFDLDFFGCYWGFSVMFSREEMAGFGHR